MKSPYIEHSKRYKRCRFTFWALIVCLLLLLFGCAKNTDSLDVIGNSAHQQIVAIKESLPKECQTKAIDEQLKAHDATVDSIIANCNTQKQVLDEERIRWKWSFLATVLIIAVYFARKILK